MSSPLTRTKKGISAHFGTAFFVATFMVIAGFATSVDAQDGQLPEPTASSSPRAGIDIALGSSGDGSYNASNLSVTATAGSAVTVELYGAGYQNVSGFTAIFELSDPAAVQSVTMAPGKAFNIKLSEPEVSGNTVTANLGFLGVTSATGNDLALLGTLNFTLSSNLGSGVGITLKTLAFQGGGGGDDVITANAVVTAGAKQVIPPTVSADLNPLPGDQNRTSLRVNPGRVFPIEIYGGNLEEITAFEIQVQVRSASNYEFNRARFATAAPFTVVEASGSGEGLPAPGASISPRVGADIARGNGDRSYSAQNLSVAGTAGGVVVVELYGTGYTDVSGFTATLELTDPGVVQDVTLIPSAAFPLRLSPPALSGNTLKATLAFLGTTSAPNTDLQLLGTLTFKLGTDLGNGLGITLKTIAFRSASDEEVIPANAVLNVATESSTVQSPSVEVSGNTLTLKAVSEQPVTGDQLLGRLSLTPAFVFRGGEITITQAVFTAGDAPVTIEPNIVLTLSSIVSDAPVVIKPPVPLTVTDTRAIIQWETNVASRGKLSYGTDPATLDQEVEISDLAKVQTARLTGLTLGTRYYFQVTNTDAEGRTSEAFPSTPRSFFTRRVADTKPPRFVSPIGVVGITTTKADVVFNTDEAAVVEVTYGTSQTDLAQTASRSSSQVKHALPLEGLTAGTQYFYRVKVTDPNGNDATSAIKDFKTRAGADETAPRFLSRPSLLGRSFNATVVRWLTDEPSSSAVLYGIDKESLSETAEVSEAVRDHKVSLGNLLANTQYFYQVRSTDASNNTATSDIFDFTTQSDADAIPPRFVGFPFVARVSDTEALVKFETNEPTTAALQFDTTTDVYSDETGTVGETVNATDAARDHEITLTNLTPGTRYYYKISVTDLANNGPTTRSSLNFVTRAVADTEPPAVFSKPQALGISRDRANISWAADEPHSATIAYGVPVDAAQPSETDLTETLEVINLKKKHLANLSGLEAGTLYVYEVTTTDAAGNAGSTGLRTFTTRSNPDTRAPKIISGPTARNITDSSVTIEWETDEVSDSRVAWGTSFTYDDVIEVADGVQVHTITLTDLEPDTKYRYKVGSSDQAGNVVTTAPEEFIIGLSRVHTFRTLKAPDTQPPVINFGPRARFRRTRALIHWFTDEPATSRIVIGAQPGTQGLPEGAPVFGEDSEWVIESNVLSIRHREVIAGLTPGVTYQFQVSSTDAAGNTVSFSPSGAAGKLQPPGGTGSFTTSTEADTQFPVITRGPTVVGATSSSLTIEWETDEDANSEVSFGTSTDNLGDLEVSGENETTHRMVLTKLAAGATYAYEVASTDFIGNGATRSKVAFGTTLSSVDLTAPVISSGPEVIYKNDRSATLRWTTSELASAEVTYGTSAANLDNVYSVPDFETEHTVTLTNLTAGTEYHFRVGATDQSNNGPAQSAVASFTTDATPDTQTPTVNDVSVIPTDSTAVVSWTTDEMSDSAVRFGTASGALDFNTGDIFDVKAHKITLTNLQPNTTYFYRVQSIDQAGNGPAQSDEGSFTTVATGDIQAPQPPSGLVVSAGNGAVKLFWSASPSSGVLGYTIERAAGGDFAPIVSIDPATAYVDQNVENGTAYTYRIAAVGAKQLASEASAPSDAVTPTADSGPGAPTLYVVQGDAVQPTIAVNNATPLNEGDVLNYTFHLSTSSDFADAVALDAGLASGAGTGGDDPQGVTAWTVPTALTTGTTYHYRVKANDGAFDSAFLTGTITPNASALPYPGDITGDKAVNFPDFLQFIGAFNKSAGEDGFVDGADINRDGKVGFPDFLSFIGVFNKKYIKGPSSGKTVVPFVYGVDADAQFQLASHPLSLEESGQEIAVDVRISNVTDLRGYGVRVSYDPASVLFLEAGDADGAFLKTGSRNAEIFGTLEHNAEQGDVFIASAITEGETVSGEGVLTTLRFRLLGDPQNALIEIAQGLVIDGKLNANAAQNLGNRFALLPTEFALEHNFPNPFNPETTIRYAVAEAGRVTLSVYNILGQEVMRLVDAQQTPGFYAVRWDGKDALDRGVASGIYLFRMQAGDFAKTNKMLLLK